MGGTQRTGTANLFDGQQPTAASEYSSRQGEKIDTLQIHHATMTSLPGLIGLMMPGGRDVSANGAMGNDGTLIEVVPLPFRAHTSATSFDRRCLTVECCNTTLAPEWGISDATHERLAQLAADMYRVGLLGSLTRAHIIGHREVPGAYSTACPGPSMDLDRIVRRANEIFSGAPAPRTQEDDMSAVRYHDADNGERANFGEFSFEAITPETHGDWFGTYSDVSAANNDGKHITDLEFAVLRQSVYNRRGDFLADIAAVATGVDPAVLRKLVRDAVAEAIDDEDTDSNTIDVAAIVQQSADELGRRLSKR